MDDCEESTLITTTRHQKILDIDRKLIKKFKQRNQFPNSINKKVVFTRERLTKVKRAILIEQFDKNSHYWPTELKDELAI